MRQLVTIAAFLGLAFAWPSPAANAQVATPKAPDVMTVDGVTQPAPALGAIPDRTGGVAAVRARVRATALPFDLGSLSPEQLAKRALVPASILAAPADFATGKPADFGTALAPAGGAAPAEKRAAAGPSMVGVFGTLPRPEWTRGLPLKPEDLVTIGAGTGLDAPAAPAKPAAPARRKAPDVRTSLPRDPNAPPAAAKPVTPGAEVRP